MAIFSFSTRNIDTEMVERVKQHCVDHGLNFSAVIVTILKQWDAENVRPKVQSSQ